MGLSIGFKSSPKTLSYEVAPRGDSYDPRTNFTKFATYFMFFKWKLADILDFKKSFYFPHPHTNM